MGQIDNSTNSAAKSRSCPRILRNFFVRSGMSHQGKTFDFCAPPDPDLDKQEFAIEFYHCGMDRGNCALGKICGFQVLLVMGHQHKAAGVKTKQIVK